MVILFGIINIILGILGIVGVFCGWTTFLEVIIILAFIKLIATLIQRIVKHGIIVGLLFGFGLPGVVAILSLLLGIYVFKFTGISLLGLIASAVVLV